MMMFSTSDVDKIHDALDEVIAGIRLPAIDIARILLFKAEAIVREEAKNRVALGRAFYEPDFVNLAGTIAGVVEHTEPDRQCR